VSRRRRRQLGAPLGPHPRLMVAGFVAGGLLVLAGVAVASALSRSQHGLDATVASRVSNPASSHLTASKPARSAVAPLPAGAALPAGAVVAMDMLSPQVGVAIAHIPAGTDDGGRSYLAQTADGGSHWQVSGSLPATMTPSQTYQVAMAFTSPRDGYVTLLSSRRTIFTGDRGRTWSAVKLPGQPTGLYLAGTSLWITTDLCTAGSRPPPLCPTDLARLRVGQLTPAAVVPIPAAGPVLGSAVHSTTFQATLLARIGAAAAIVAEGQEGLPVSLLQTQDAGRSWTVLYNPCGRLDVAGLAHPTAQHWILYCNLSGGMNQGTSQLWTTADAGLEWQLVAEASETGPPRGNIGAGIAGDLSLSGNGRILWLLGAVGGIADSTDGGQQWQSQNINTGGYDGRIVTAGASGAWLPLPGVGIYRTLTGATWALLP
jgi:hypothetical protein